MSSSDSQDERKPRAKSLKVKEKKRSLTPDRNRSPSATPHKRSKCEAKILKNADGDDIIELGNFRFASVRTFKGKVLVDIREYYDRDGKLWPGKKGICLSVNQWNTLKSVSSVIDNEIKK